LPIDDLNDWIGVLGTNANVKTPNIDALAGEGMLFTNAHAQAPICAPSRASLMSGLLPHQTGIYGQVGDSRLRGAINAVASTSFLTEYLKDNGYYTAGRGKLFHHIEWAIENNEWRPILQAYLASISFADYCIGIAVDALKASAYADNTLPSLMSAIAIFDMKMARRSSTIF